MSNTTPRTTNPPNARRVSPLPRKASQSQNKSAPPLGTKAKQKSRAFARKTGLTSRLTEEQLATRREELKSLPDLIRAKFKTWTGGAQDFQLKCMESQVLQRDTILHAKTGAGKTGIAAGPHALESTQGRVTLFVSPLVALQMEQVSYFFFEIMSSRCLTLAGHHICR